MASIDRLLVDCIEMRDYRDAIAVPGGREPVVPSERSVHCHPERAERVEGSALPHWTLLLASQKTEHG
jgi:hypothetical protein